MPDRFKLDEETFLLVLTGAGVSAESGLPTFRDANGLWESHRIEEVATPEAFTRDPALVWRFYSQRREAAHAVEPNAAHRALAGLEARLQDRFLLATQTVDGLHARAGNRRIVELHGSLLRSRCSRCGAAPFEEATLHGEELPRCGACDALLRPDVVWFGEALDPARLEQTMDFIRGGARQGRLVFLAIGTSGSVYPAAGLVEVVGRAGGESWLFNAEPAENTQRFDHFVRGQATKTLPPLVGAAA